MSARLWSNFDSVRFGALYGVVRFGWLVMILLPFCVYVSVVACVGVMGSVLIVHLLMEFRRALDELCACLNVCKLIDWLSNDEPF
jgi:hypothetical protein